MGKRSFRWSRASTPSHWTNRPFQIPSLLQEGLRIVGVSLEGLQGRKRVRRRKRVSLYRGPVSRVCRRFRTWLVRPLRVALRIENTWFRRPTGESRIPPPQLTNRKAPAGTRAPVVAHRCNKRPEPIEVLALSPLHPATRAQSYGRPPRRAGVTSRPTAASCRAPRARGCGNATRTRCRPYAGSSAPRRELMAD